MTSDQIDLYKGCYNEIMHFIILGSGGCTLIPRPCCFCPVCTEAREEGIPYQRTGPSLFLEDIHALFDTPEEVSHQLARESIERVDHIFYTHWHPDHTAGMRVIEQLNLYFLAFYIEGKTPSEKIEIHALPEVMDDLKAIRSKHGPYLDYYESAGSISTKVLTEPLKIGDFEIVALPVENPEFISTVFVIKNQGKKVGYAPCDTKPFPSHELLKDLDLLMIGNILPDGALKDGYTIPEGNPLRTEVFTMHELTELISHYHIKKTVAVHIEEEWGKSLDDYERIEEEYHQYNIKFAFDGMRIEV